jgi:ribosomal protein L37AE/L43A
MKLKKISKCPVCNSTRIKQSNIMMRCDNCGYSNMKGETKRLNTLNGLNKHGK